MGQVIRIFTDTPRNAADSASLHRATLMQCHADACQSGRIACPCPEACEVTTDAHAAAVFWRLYLLAVVAVAVCLTLAAAQAQAAELNNAATQAHQRVLDAQTSRHMEHTTT